MNRFASEFVRAVPRIGLAIACVVSAMNGVAVLIAQQDSIHVLGSVVLTAVFGLATIAASAFAEAPR